MSLREDLRVSTHAMEIIDRDLKDNKEKILVAQILNNYYVRGLLLEVVKRCMSAVFVVFILILTTD